MDKLLEEFIKEWRLKNNTKDAVYSSYHYDAMTEFAKHYHTQQLILSGVVDSKRFTETDLLNGYQAGCIEGLDDCCDLGLDDLKEIKEDGKKWVKRYTE
tara:strand:- start:674 stop:970 length:297 start_codon:yes stop_codon:yes gene_type:complete